VLGRLLEIIVLLLVIRAAWRVVGSMIKVSAGTQRTDASGEPRAVKLVRDPVCGMTVNPAAGKPTAEHGGQLYHFCSEHCRSKFVAEPEKYLGGRPEPQPVPKGTQYTCPMHPEIVRPEPGFCPICGMALEPRTVVAEETNPELVGLWLAGECYDQ
jgi:Cu+-exporting ATPase